jgi:predicted Zn-dependent protease with MMP-like domain
VLPLEREAFEELVGQALDALPDGLLAHLDNVVLAVEDDSTDEPGLLGLYEGVPLTEREVYSGVLPDRVTLFRLPLCAAVEDLAELEEQVRITVVHELAHHVGMGEQRLHELGWG